ncbi:MAG: hypothetical protein LLF28_05225 [Nitrospiraceae bacterium]|nr:hypothetical protein [Nitrospiraceae bacterium]
MRFLPVIIAIVLIFFAGLVFLQIRSFSQGQKFSLLKFIKHNKLGRFIAIVILIIFMLMLLRLMGKIAVLVMFILLLVLFLTFRKI